jgi:glycosylphosphatidylinositol phospholipase D
VLTLGDGSFLDAVGAGDLDGDGFDDLVFGNGSADDAGVGAGRADVVMGSAAPASVDVEVAASSSWLGDAALAQMGVAVAAGGDVDANGDPDLLIGQPGIEDGGAVTLILWHR